ncbi:MAG: ATP-binding protein, partial [bacterium]
LKRIEAQYKDLGGTKDGASAKIGTLLVRIEALQAEKQKARDVYDSLRTAYSTRFELQNEKRTFLAHLQSVASELKHRENLLQKYAIFPVDDYPRLQELLRNQTRVAEELADIEAEQRRMDLEQQQFEERLRDLAIYRNLQESQVIEARYLFQQRQKTQDEFNKKTGALDAQKEGHRQKLLKLQRLQEIFGDNPEARIQELEEVLTDREAIRNVERKIDDSLNKAEHAVEVFKLKKMIPSLFGWFVTALLFITTGLLWFFYTGAASLACGALAVFAAFGMWAFESRYSAELARQSKEVKRWQIERDHIGETLLAKEAEKQVLLKKADAKSMDDLRFKVLEYREFQNTLHKVSFATEEGDLQGIQGELDEDDKRLNAFLAKIKVKGPMTAAILDQIEANFNFVKQSDETHKQHEEKRRGIDRDFQKAAKTRDAEAAELATLLKKAKTPDATAFEAGVRSREALLKTQETIAQIAKFLDEQAIALDPKATAPDLEGLSLKELFDRFTGWQKGFYETEKKLGALDAQIEEREASVRPPQEIDEELVQQESTTALWTHRWNALVKAKMLLEEAAKEIYEQLSPRVNNEFEAFFSRLTKGRYEEGLVHQELKLMVRAPETGELVEVNPSASALSAGATLQAYLALRLALARVMDDGSPAGPLPLLLDDPLVNFDPERADAAAQLLADFAKTHQILFFTCHDRESALIQKRVPGSKLLPLPKL